MWGLYVAKEKLLRALIYTVAGYIVLYFLGVFVSFDFTWVSRIDTADWRDIRFFTFIIFMLLVWLIDVKE